MKSLFLALVGLMPAVAHAEPKIPRVEAIVDFSAKDGGQAALESLSNALGGSDPIIFLELKLIAPPSSEVTDEQLSAGLLPKLPISFQPREGKAKQTLCENNFDQEGMVGFQTSSIYPHLLLRVVTESPRVNPFVSVACGYDSSNPISPAFYVRGYYTRRYDEVATAYSVTLWPVRLD